MVLTAFLAAALVGAPTGAVTATSPDFARFSAPVTRVQHAAPLRLLSARDRRSRSALRAAARGRADFAGHWVLAQIGCGASCIEIAVIDKISGRIVWFPATVCCWPLAISEPLTYRRDSRLLLLQGELNETGIAASRAFVFDGVRFAPLKG